MSEPTCAPDAIVTRSLDRCGLRALVEARWYQGVPGDPWAWRCWATVKRLTILDPAQASLWSGIDFAAPARMEAGVDLDAEAREGFALDYEFDIEAATHPAGPAPAATRDERLREYLADLDMDIRREDARDGR